MAKKIRIVPQDYPRIKNPGGKEDGLLDTNYLVQHKEKIPREKIINLVVSAIKNANAKSGRVILNIPESALDKEKEKIYIKEGKALFRYFRKYCGDPASTAYDLKDRHYSDVCIEQFRIRSLQKERMNSGWRYQYLAKKCAHESKRFQSVSDIGASEADFNVIIAYEDNTKEPLALYVSVKNRVNTLGGQDWPKAIYALEDVAITDKNRLGHYCCVFGITIDRGDRIIKNQQKTKQPYSVNTEIWLSDFFWPFFANYSFEEIMKIVLQTLINENEKQVSLSIEIPKTLIETFGKECKTKGIVDNGGNFTDPEKLVEFFCRHV
jgi:hypothetical protein